jgi:hypothetical protein
MFQGTAFDVKAEAGHERLCPGRGAGGRALLRRASAIWLFFVPVQIWAAIKTENPTALRTVSILRLQEVPADPIWLATGEGFGIFGKFGLVFAPVFNLVVGIFLWLLARDLEKKEGQAA